MEPDSVIYISLCVGFFFFVDWLRARIRRNKELKRKDDFLPTYEKVIAQHGEIYKKESLPLDDTDIKAVNKYYNAINILLIICSTGFFAVPIGVLYFNLSWSTKETLEAVGFAAVIVAAFIAMRHFRNKALSNEKVVIQGVITDKKKTNKRKSSTYYVEISNKDSVEISKKDFNKFNLGDIVKTEEIATLSVKNKIIFLGKLEANNVNTSTL